jgi:hypothetical protein
MAMSDNTDWMLIVQASQRAQRAAEAALATTTLWDSEFGGRLSSIEARLTGVETRLSAIAAMQHSHELALMRVTDTLAGHTASLTRIETALKRLP